MPTAPKKVAPKTVAEKKQQSDANRRYTEAVRRLKAKYADEFIATLTEVYAQEGQTYKPQMTAEEKAEAKRQAKVDAARARIAAMQAEFPELALMGPAPTTDWENPDQVAIDV